MLYFVGDSYSNGSPGENRFDGICRGISRQGKAITRVFIRPNEQRLKSIDKESGVRYVYLWEGKRFHTGKLRHIQQIFWIVSFLRSVKSEDYIVVTNSDYLFVYSWFPKLHIYHEKSEYPELHLSNASLPLRWIHKSYIATCRKIDGVFPISYALKDYFVEKGVSPEKIQVINMTVDPARFISLKKMVLSEKYIAYCGAISNYKDGVDALIKSFALFAQKVPDIKLYIIGNFPFQKDKEEDYALVNALGVSDRVVFTGPIHRESMPQMLKNAQALVLARPDNVQAKYGFPTKLGEYLLTGNPVVITKVGDIPKFLKDGESAFIAEPGDVNEFASKMIEAVTSPSANSIGENGFKIAMQRFNSEFEAKKIIDFIYGKK